MGKPASSVGLWVCAPLILYFFCYAVFYQCRKPAANLAYFCYPLPDGLDAALYYGFWPIYRLHRAVADAGRHNLDRPNLPVASAP